MSESQATFQGANSPAQQMQDLLTRQRQQYQLNPMPSLSSRKQQLIELKKAILRNQDKLCKALDEDYGQRSQYDTLISDLLPAIAGLNYSVKNLKKWMKPSRRHAGLLLSPASVKVHYQPLGVVGIVVPWNFPVMLSLGPLTAALAAGNRAMIKLSEFTPKTNAVIREVLASVFTEDQVVVFEGEADVAAEFTKLPFDHLLFTGSTAVGKHVMRAAADNLTPVTLELGGKSPVIIADDIDLDLAVERLIFGKCMNAGQICVAPDYVLIPEGKQQAFIEAYKKAFTKMYPKGVSSKDYSSVVNQRQFKRLRDWMADAEAKGASIIPAHASALDDLQHRMVTHLIIDTKDDMILMQEEIFGPLLPVIPYQSLDQAIQYVQARPRPLALYLMSMDPKIQKQVTEQCHAGGMCINESLLHVGADDAPFGGVGPSGMGHYHGKEGFLTFSKAKTVLKAGKFGTGKLVHPPYGKLVQKIILKTFMS